MQDYNCEKSGIYCKKFTVLLDKPSVAGGGHRKANKATV